MAAEVFQIPVGTMQNFVYLLMDTETREAIAIDSGWETVPIVNAARSKGMRVKFVVATHGHFDHVETIRELAAQLGAKVVAHERSSVKSDVSVKDGDALKFGDLGVRVIYTPGHTLDSICLYDGAHLFTGDTLFVGAWGRTDLPGGSSKTLFSSLHERIMKLPPGTVVYPGHDYGDVPSRTLAEESRANPALRARDELEFSGLVQEG